MAINLGSEYVFNSGETDEINVTMLDATHAIIVYRDVATSQYGTAVIATISGTEITYGSEYVFAYSGAPTCHVARISDTQAVIAYTGTNQYGTARIATVSNGNEISFGTAVVYASYVSYIHSVAVLDSTHFIVAFQDAGDATIEAKAVVGVINGTAIDSYGTVVTVNANTSYKVNVTALDSTHAAICYQDSTGSWLGYVKIAVISSGTTITLGSAYEINTSSPSYIEVAALDSTHFVVAYMDEASSLNYGKARIGVLTDGNVVTFGDVYTFNSASTAYISLCKVDASTAAITYKDVGNSNYGTVILATVSNGDDIAYGSETTFNSGITEFTSVSYLGSDKAIIAYQDETNSSYGTGIIASLGLAPTLTATFDVDHIDLEWSSLA